MKTAYTFRVAAHGARPSRALAALCGLGLALLFAIPLWAACAQSPAMHGWPITPTPATEFVLTSQSGQPVKLSDYKGDLAVVTFMYSHCTTACPLISLGMKMAQEQLTPNEAGRVHFLAVSVDPERDTPENIAKFIEGRPYPQGLLWLTGPRLEMEQVWKAYKVETRQVLYTPTPPPAETPTPASMAGMGEHKSGSTGEMREHKSDSMGEMREGKSHEGHVGYIVEHTVLAYLVDQKGVLRSAYVVDSSFTPDDMVKDIRALLAAK